jgi:hypothetical protein
MKSLGYSLITVGFLVGAYVAVQQRVGVPVALFLAALALGALGVALVRVAGHRESRHAETLNANLGVVDSSLQRIVDKVRRLEEDKGEIDVYELRHHIDREFPDDLDTFVQARKSLAHSFGLQAYADVMNPFAAGERYLNRVWSTSTDGYIDEAHRYITLAREQFETSLKVLRDIESPSDSTDAT